MAVKENQWKELQHTQTLKTNDTVSQALLESLIQPIFVCL